MAGMAEVLEEPETAGVRRASCPALRLLEPKALRVRLELALFPSSVCFPSPRPATSPQRTGVLK